MGDNIHSETTARLKESLEEHIETIDVNVRVDYYLVGINGAIDKQF